MYEIDELWRFLPFGYCLTILFEIPVLLIGLSKLHPLKDKLIAGFGLTAFTYPVVILVLPMLFPNSRLIYLIVAETFAPVAECWLFGLLFHSADLPRWQRWRNYAAIVMANLVSFSSGELLKWAGWL